MAKPEIEEGYSELYTVKTGEKGFQVIPLS